MAFGGVCRGTRAAIILSMLESQPSSGYTRWRACLHAHNKCVHGYACSWPSKVFTRDVVPRSCWGRMYVRTYARLWIKDREDGDCNLEQAGTNTVRSVNDLIISSYYHPWTRIYSIYGNRDIIDFPRYIIFHSYKIISLSFFFLIFNNRLRRSLNRIFF